MDFDDNVDKLRVEYLDMYEEVKSEVLNTAKFDENSDLSMTCFGRIDLMRVSEIKTEEKFPISGKGYIIGKLLHGRTSDIFRHRR